MNESHRPIPGKLYRLMGSPLKHLTLNAFKSQNSLYGGGEFKFCPEEAFLLCLPKLKREHIRQPYDFFSSEWYSPFSCFVWFRFASERI